MVVDVGVPITEDVVLARDIIIGHSIWRQDRADAKFLAIMVGWVSLANNIVVETGRSSTPRTPPIVPVTAPTAPPTTAPTAPASLPPRQLPLALPKSCLARWPQSEARAYRIVTLARRFCRSFVARWLWCRRQLAATSLVPAVRQRLTTYQLLNTTRTKLSAIGPGASHILSSMNEPPPAQIGLINAC